MGFPARESERGALAEAAAGADVIVAVESLGEGARLWFYRNIGGTRELIGRVVPVRLNE